MRVRKRFGQNFLVDANVINQIVAAVDPRPGEHVIEIGPGRGALTDRLIKTGCQLDVIEIDRDLAAELVERHPRLNVISADVLKVDLASLVGDGTRIVGNLPYNISTPLLFRLFGTRGIKDMHFMLQYEVVERMTAQPSSGSYGRLSVMSQYHCEARQLFTVPPTAFVPQPKVVSAIVRLVPRAFAPVAINETTLSLLLTRAFSQRRKTIRNALKPFLNEAELVQLGLDPSARPENLSVSDFVRSANFVSERGDVAE